MANEDDLVAKAQGFLSEQGIEDQVIAAGVFDLADNYKAIAAGGVATSLVLPSHSPLMSGVSAGATIVAAREATAKSEGVSARMMLAVTADTIYLLSVPQVGTTPQHLLLKFERANTKVEIHHFGLSRKLALEEVGGSNHIKLVGTEIKWSAQGAGDKAVLSELLS